MDHAGKARELFREGYNCSQAVLCAFEDLTGLDRDSAARIASSFGGGMGRMREVCGSVTGAFMVLGMVCGYADPKDRDAKKDHYHLIQRYADRFREENGSIICRELLFGVETIPGKDPEERSSDYYRKRPCPDLVWFSAKLLEDIIEEE